MNTEPTPTLAAVAPATTCSRRLCGQCGKYEDQCSCSAPCPAPFLMGDKRRFHWRILNNGYEVYSIGLDQWALCATAERAEAVADALEAFYANRTSHP